MYAHLWKNLQPESLKGHGFSRADRAVFLDFFCGLRKNSPKSCSSWAETRSEFGIKGLGSARLKSCPVTKQRCKEFFRSLFSPRTMAKTVVAPKPKSSLRWIMYDLASIEAALSGTVFARKLHYAESTGSTNDDALQAARAGARDGSVYVANEQTAGRGRGDHEWHSVAGEGLYVSVLLRPPFPVSRLPLLPLAAGLAAADAIHATTALTVDLRWPNDLLIGPRKTGGILVESHIERGSVAFAVVGIGINVHQHGFSSGLDTPATSLDLETGATASRQSLLIALLKSLESEVLAMRNRDAGQAIPRRVELNSTWVGGRRVEVHGPQACVGVTEGLDENGFLRVMTPGGVVTVQTGGLRAAAD
jgi:BirA family transcriptional regulator, biotin operon repressor / biotin---[acetyl-CoA-carboxylase] ligase